MDEDWENANPVTEATQADLVTQACSPDTQEAKQEDHTHVRRDWARA